MHAIRSTFNHYRLHFWFLIFPTLPHIHTHTHLIFTYLLWFFFTFTSTSNVLMYEKQQPLDSRCAFRCKDVVSLAFVFEVITLICMYESKCKKIDISTQIQNYHHSLVVLVVNKITRHLKTLFFYLSRRTDWDGDDDHWNFFLSSIFSNFFFSLSWTWIIM